MATTRTRKTTPAKKTTPARKATPRKAPAKQTPAKKAAPLPVRTADWMTDAQGYATLAARIAGIPTFLIQDWRSHRDDTATRTLGDGTLLHYDLNTRTLTWQATCPMGAVHAYPLTGPSAAAAARVHVARCTTAHADLSVIPALTADQLAELGILHTPTWAKTLPGEPEVTETLPVPLPARPRVLADQLTHSRTATADTQPLSRDEIAAGLSARTADTEIAKEHPEP